MKPPLHCSRWFNHVQSIYAQTESELLSSIPMKNISSSRYIPIIKDNHISQNYHHYLCWLNHAIDIFCWVKHQCSPCLVVQSLSDNLPWNPPFLLVKPPFFLKGPTPRLDSESPELCHLYLSGCHGHVVSPPGAGPFLSCWLIAFHLFVCWNRCLNLLFVCCFSAVSVFYCSLIKYSHLILAAKNFRDKWQNGTV